MLIKYNHVHSNSSAPSVSFITKGYDERKFSSPKSYVCLWWYFLQRYFAWFHICSLYSRSFFDLHSQHQIFKYFLFGQPTFLVYYTFLFSFLANDFKLFFVASGQYLLSYFLRFFTSLNNFTIHAFSVGLYHSYNLWSSLYI